MARCYVSPARRTHILDGDASGGGHRFGAGKGRSEFPAAWTDDEIIDEIEDVANDTSSTFSTGPNGRWRMVGVRRGVSIKVVVDPANAEIVTGCNPDTIGGADD